MDPNFPVSLIAKMNTFK